MKTVHIPKSESPMWECNVNNVIYRYPQDTYQTVPDAVASVIDSSERAIPKQDKTDPATWLVYKQGGWQVDDTGSGGSCDCGSVAHLSTESVDLIIEGDTYPSYPLDKSYKDLLEYPSPFVKEDWDGIKVYSPMLFETNATAYEGYRYKVTFVYIDPDDPNNPVKTIVLYAESETGTLYFIPLE